MSTCDEEAVDDEIDGQEVILEHLVDGESAGQDPKQAMDPDGLPHVSLVLASQHHCSQVPGSCSEQVQEASIMPSGTLRFVVGRVEERGGADETQQEHGEVQIAIEEGQLVLDHITRWQHLHYHHSLPYTSVHRCFCSAPRRSPTILTIFSRGSSARSMLVRTRVL